MNDDEVPRSHEDLRHRVQNEEDRWWCTGTVNRHGVKKVLSSHLAERAASRRRERVKTWEISKKHIITWYWTMRASGSRERTDDLWGLWVNNDGAKQSRFPTSCTYDQVHPLQAQHVADAVYAYAWSIGSLKSFEHVSKKIFSTRFHFVHFYVQSFIFIF